MEDLTLCNNGSPAILLSPQLILRISVSNIPASFNAGYYGLKVLSIVNDDLYLHEQIVNPVQGLLNTATQYLSSRLTTFHEPEKLS